MRAFARFELVAGRHARRAVVAAAATVAVVVGLLPYAPAARAEVAVTYPHPLPDFSHPDEPHAPLFHDRGETGIPLLVVYATFTDLTNLSESGAQDKFFPLFQFGNVADYYLQNDMGVLVPAQETYGLRDNGVVLVDLGLSAPAIAEDPAQRRRKMMDLADPFVDFARYDTDRDGTVENSELAVATMFTSRPGTDNCGQTRGVAAGAKLDGKTIGFTTGDGGSATNELTFAHELAHQMYDLADHYGFGVGSWDIAGPTCGRPNRWFEPNAWHKLHLGGQSPTVVTKDRYITVSDLSIDTSYLLYDPERGTDDYLLVEARAPKAGTYEQDVPDSGVVVWRIDERNVRAGGGEHQRGVELLRPDGTRSPGCVDEDVDGRANEDPPDGSDNDGDGQTDEDGLDGQVDNDGDGRVNEDPPDGLNNDGDGGIDEDGPEPEEVACDGGDDTDAWDPGDARTPQRTMDRPWADGTPAKVAVRAIGRPFFATTPPTPIWWSHFYADVRGPGILVDPADASGNAPRPTLTLGDTTDLTFTVRNTGEATDTFEFTELVPGGWSATTQRMTLAAGQQATATIRVTVPTNAAISQHTLFARGRSTTDPDVQTDYQFLADVTKRTVDIDYTGDTTVDYSDPAALSATVRDHLTGQPVPGKQVSFQVAGQTLPATTGVDGVARATWLADADPATYRVRVESPEDGLYQSAGGGASVVVEPEQVQLAVTSSLIQAAGSQPRVTVQATQEADGHLGDITRGGVRVTLTPTLTGATHSFTAAFDATGVAHVPITAPADVWSMTYEVTGTHFTGSVSTAELVLFNPAGLVSGAGRGPDRAGNNVRVTIAAVYQAGIPQGTVIVDRGPRFTSSRINWFVVVGNTAIFEAAGTVDGIAAVARGRITDGGTGGTSTDTISVRINSGGGTTTYESGTVTLNSGGVLVQSSVPATS